MIFKFVDIILIGKSRLSLCLKFFEGMLTKKKMIKQDENSLKWDNKTQDYIWNCSKVCWKKKHNQ